MTGGISSVCLQKFKKNASLSEMDLKKPEKIPENTMLTKKNCQVGLLRKDHIG